jgi:Holliday junction resolvasome RuvABC endonuclease subunit
MLTLPQSSPIYRVMGIDPGTDTLGTAIIDIDLEKRTMVVAGAETQFGAKMANNFRPFAEVWGERAAKLRAHEENLYEVLYAWQPHSVIIESPFMGRFPQAAFALVECVVSIKRAVYRYNRMMTGPMIDPVSAKKAAGIVGSVKKLGKEAVRQHLKRIPYLQYAPGVNLDALDEHSVDAIAVAHYRCLEVVRYLQWRG